MEFSLACLPTQTSIPKERTYGAEEQHEAAVKQEHARAEHYEAPVKQEQEMVNVLLLVLVLVLWPLASAGARLVLVLGPCLHKESKASGQAVASWQLNE